MKRCEDSLECGADRGDISLASHLGYKASARTKRTMNAGECCRLLLGWNPVKGCIGEDGVKLVDVRQVVGAAEFNVEVALASGGDHRGGGVDAGDNGSGCGQLLGQSAVAAAHVQDVFSRLRGKERDNAGGEGGDEAAVGGISIRVPGLAWSVHLTIVDGVGTLRGEDKHFLELHKWWMIPAHPSCGAKDGLSTVEGDWIPAVQTLASGSVSSVSVCRS